MSAYVDGPSEPLRPSLFDLADEDGVSCPGQWRLARIELVNWGTFSGHHRLDVSRDGMLITGESGSGKSTLLDAVACVLTPPRALKLNAAARSEGSRVRDRDLCSYIRGAWNSRSDDLGEVSRSYLRDKSATWSGVLLRYECGLERKPAKNLIALYHLKANCNKPDGLSTAFVLVDGDCSLPEFEPYVRNGVEIKPLNRDFKDRGRAWRDHSSFSARFCRDMGVRGNKTLELLHRTQAAKNFGSLNDLFRRFMLDEPKTFEQKDKAVEQFSTLRQAYADVVDQREQMETLQPLVDGSIKLDAAQKEAEELDRLKLVLPAYTEQRVIGGFEKQRVKLKQEVRSLDDEVVRATSELDQAKKELSIAQERLSSKGGAALDQAELDCRSYEYRVKTVEQNRDRLKAELKPAGVESLPKDHEAWSDLVARTLKEAQAAEAKDEKRRADTESAYASLNAARQRIDEVESELRYLRSHPSNIPSKLNEVRAEIAQELGVKPFALPFVGELVEVRDEYADWEGAINRVLSSQAKTLLVAHCHAQAVARFLDGRHLGLRFEFEDVPENIEVPSWSPKECSLIARVEVLSHSGHPEYSKWVNKLIRNDFDYICVDSSDELQNHRKALTRAGQVKRGRRYIKDDRNRVDDKKFWVLGAANGPKIEALVIERDRLELQCTQAQKLAEEAERKRDRMRDLRRIADTLVKADWVNYDILTARSDLVNAQRFLEQLQVQSSGLDELRHVRDEAQARSDAADERLRELRVKAEGCKTKLERTEFQLEAHRKRLKSHEEPDKHERERLDGLFEKLAKKKTEFEDFASSEYSVSQDVQRELEKQSAGVAKRSGEARRAIERAIDDYRRQWPSQAADLGLGCEAREEYLSIHQSIKKSALPKYEQNFLNVLNDFSQDQITIISSTIRDAPREVRDRIRQVNDSLMLSEYSSGVHLQIGVKECRSAQAKDFLDDLKAITTGSYDSTNLAEAEERYRRTARVMDRLQASDNASRNWQKECLDTRLHVSFVAKEIDEQGEELSVHDDDAGLSGGQKQELVVFCLAAALRYQLSDEGNPIPSYGTVMLDEAFDKADRHVTENCLNILEKFGFQLVLATPMKSLSIFEDHVGGLAYVDCRDRRESTVQSMEFQRDAPAEDDAHESGSAEEGEDAAAEKRSADKTLPGATATATTAAGASTDEGPLATGPSVPQADVPMEPTKHKHAGKHSHKGQQEESLF